MKKAIGILILSIFIGGCSWQEYFVLENNSDSSIVVSYSLSQANGFPIFDEAAAYMTTNSGEIDWNKKITIKDADISALGFQFTLPPNSRFIFGRLSNDHYSNCSQYFINGRVFNFQQMEIKMKDRNITITKDGFDSYFKKKNGCISYEVK
jgi:hypothetical protein